MILPRQQRHLMKMNSASHNEQQLVLYCRRLAQSSPTDLSDIAPIKSGMLHAKPIVKYLMDMQLDDNIAYNLTEFLERMVRALEHKKETSSKQQALAKTHNREKQLLIEWKKPSESEAADYKSPVI